VFFHQFPIPFQMAALASPVSRSTMIWFGSLEFMSTGSGYDMILLSIKGLGGARIAPARLRAPRRPRHHASTPKKRHGQQHRRPSASSRPAVRAKHEVTRELTALHAESVGMMAQRREDHTTTRGDAPRALPHHQVTSTWVVHSKKGAAVRIGQRRSVARQGNMPKCPDVRGETNGPPMPPWSTATDVRGAGFLPGTRPPSPRPWTIHDHLAQAAAAGGGTWMFLRHRAGLRLRDR
jgi:hypothetical protein